MKTNLGIKSTIALSLSPSISLLSSPLLSSPLQQTCAINASEAGQKIYVCIMHWGNRGIK